jgi:hypothetical protein
MSALPPRATSRVGFFFASIILSLVLRLHATIAIEVSGVPPEADSGVSKKMTVRILISLYFLSLVILTPDT